MYDVMIIWYSDNVRMWEYDSIHMIIWSNGKKIDRQILETWLKNLRFWIEIWVPKPSFPNILKPWIWGPPAPKTAFGESRAVPKGSQRLTRGAWGIQTVVTEAALRRLWAPWGLPGEALAPAWGTPGDHFGAILDPKLNYFAANCFGAVSLKFLS